MKRLGRPDLPIVRKGMPITVLHNGVWINAAGEGKWWFRTDGTAHLPSIIAEHLLLR